MHDGQLVFSLVVFWVLAFDDPRGHFSVEIQHPHLPESNMPCLSFFLTTINPSGQRWRFRVCASSFSTSGWVFFVLRPFQWRDFQRCCANFCGPNTKIFRDFHVFSSIGSWFYGSFRDPVMNWIIIDIYIYPFFWCVCVCLIFSSFPLSHDIAAGAICGNQAIPRHQRSNFSAGQSPWPTSTSCFRLRSRPLHHLEVPQWLPWWISKNPMTGVNSFESGNILISCFGCTVSCCCQPPSLERQLLWSSVALCCEIF